MRHNNDYKIDIRKIFDKSFVKLPKLSVVIPYYEAWNTINRTLEYLIKALNNNIYEIIVVDDGSSNYPAKKVIDSSFQNNVYIKTLPSNIGRSGARNAGLRETKNEVVSFMDADMVMSEDLINKHLKLHAYFGKTNKGCITFSLFNNVSMKEWDSMKIKDVLFSKTNDFRIECDYKESWIGCEEDREFIGKKFQILKDTNNLRKWPINKSFGPWLLPNMVLGGFFTVNREKALLVGGFSEDFKQYGFTETPVSTKIIAEFDDYVIPVPSPYILHLHDGGSSLNQEERNKYFKKAHELFFNVYLEEDLEKVVKNEKIQGGFY